MSWAEVDKEQMEGAEGRGARSLASGGEGAWGKEADTAVHAAPHTAPHHTTQRRKHCPRGTHYYTSPCQGVTQQYRHSTPPSTSTGYGDRLIFLRRRLPMPEGASHPFPTTRCPTLATKPKTYTPIAGRLHFNGEC
ncbi:hypothetical protein E2C01_039241 [Portunus trituberculatus]|uniref:Uncharacterized protein n=1 Tax=Portunus trituberculatus TaxID=210409 RepID=A0A5B7FD50_PORTR|nr:hypothetical protein [Portunus trituberculatus]